jgi:hypothetical protein
VSNLREEQQLSVKDTMQYIGESPKPELQPFDVVNEDRKTFKVHTTPNDECAYSRGPGFEVFVSRTAQGMKQISEYERIRESRMKANQDFLRQLGLDCVKGALHPSTFHLHTPHSRLFTTFHE